MVYTLLFFFSSLKCSLFHNSNLFGACIIHILYTECAKIKKNNSRAKRLRMSDATSPLSNMPSKACTRTAFFDLVLLVFVASRY